MTLTQLEYALAVDLHRHFGKAAKACFVSQPTLSMQIQKLEDTLGVPLFDRDKKPILPTAAGRRILAQAKLAIAELKKIPLVAKGESDEPSGEFNLAVIPTLAPYLIPLFIGRFAVKYPRVTLQIRELQTAPILEAIDRDEIDAAILVTPLQSPGLREDPLFYEPFYLYARKDHPLARKSQVSESDLDGRELWLLSEGHCMRNQMARICSLKSGGAANRGPHRSIRFESGNLETLKRLVERNEGYTLLPELALRSGGGSSAVAIPFQAPAPSREVSLVFRRTQFKQAILRALAETVRAAVPERLRDFRKARVEVVGIQ